MVSCGGTAGGVRGRRRGADAIAGEWLSWRGEDKIKQKKLNYLTIDFMVLNMILNPKGISYGERE